MAMSGGQCVTSRLDGRSRLSGGNLLTQVIDNDDDGETAAGGRLAHLLQILVGSSSPALYLDVVHRVYAGAIQEVENVLVVVTRYFGGIHLGPDRFKHINQAARNALELGGFLDVPDEGNTGRRKGKGHGKR